jgi:hypothetical protein
MEDEDITVNPASDRNETSGERFSISPRSLAIGLGCFSVALGLAELAMPRRMARAIGAVPDTATSRLLRAFGVREIATGAAILAQPHRPGLLWSRVGGDVLDLSSLQTMRRAPKAGNWRHAAATWAVLGVSALDVLCAARLSRDGHDDASRGRWRTIYKNTPTAAPLAREGQV